MKTEIRHTYVVTLENENQDMNYQESQIMTKTEVEQYAEKMARDVQTALRAASITVQIQTSRQGMSGERGRFVNAKGQWFDGDGKQK